MATTRETLEFLIKADGSAAGKTFQSLGRDADQAATKLGSRSGLSGSLQQIGTFVGNNLPGFIAAGGAAIAGFALKSAGDFADVALAAGKLSDATGLSTEQASRWLEVAGDIGISSDTVTSAFGKLNKTIGENPAKFEAIGITAKDTQGRILQAIDAINATADPAQKSALAAQLFGKGWQQAAELIAQGSGSIKTNLAAVADIKVTTSQDVADARKYRAAMDELGDSVQELGLAFGKSLVPGIAAAASGLAKMLSLPGVKDVFQIVGAGAEAAGEAIQNLSVFLGGSSDEAINAKEQYTALADEFEKVGNRLLTVTDVVGAENAKNEDYRKYWQPRIDAANQYRAALQSQALDEAAAASSSAALAASTEDVAKQMEAAAKSTDQARKAEQTLRDSRNASLDASIAAIDAEKRRVELGGQAIQAIQDASTAEDEYAKAVQTHGKASDQAKQAQDKYNAAVATSNDKIFEYAKGALDARDAQAKASNQTLNATQRNAVFASSLLDAAGNSKTAQAAAANYIGQLNEIPADKKTEIQAAINRGDITYAQAVLNSLKGTAVVGVYADLRNFYADVAAARRYASSTVTVPGSPYGGRRYTAAGDTNMSAGWSMVGERGPEAIYIPQGSSVVPNHRLADLGGGGSTINIYMPPGSDGADVVTALERYAQRSGRARLRSLVA